jgi:lipopolysaccharide transport system permease protein
MVLKAFLIKIKINKNLESIINNGNHFNFRSKIREVYQYKDLLWILAWRDYKVKYAQTALGFLWAILQPVATLVILVFIFGKVAKVDTGGVPHPIYTQSAMLAWTYFAFLLNQAGSSLIGAQNMIKKIYFPRLIIPLSKAVVGLIDFLISFILLVGLMLYYQFVPSSNIIYLPFFLILVVMAGLGVGIWVSALTIRFRDFNHLIPFVVQFGLYVSPIAYPVSNVPTNYLMFYYLNPIAGIIECVRWSIVGGETPSFLVLISLGVVLFLFFSSVWYFNKVEKVMADIV